MIENENQNYLYCTMLQIHIRFKFFFSFVATASSHYRVHSAQQAIDGISTSETCYWSESSVSSWWELDLGVDIAINKIRITHTVRVCV